MGVSEKLWNRTSELFQVVYSSATAAVRGSVCKSTTSSIPSTVCTGTYYTSIHFTLSLIEQLSIYDVERKYLLYDANDTEELHTLVEQIEQDKDTTLTSEASLKFCRAIARCKEYLSENSRTAKLLIQYIHYINIVKQFIRAGRTGNWQNYLTVVHQILNLFSVTAHFQFAKFARLCLQLMDEPPIDFLWLYNLFQQGYYTIRRSDRFWSGLLTDLAIEQSLMRTAKSRKGLKC